MFRRSHTLAVFLGITLFVVPASPAVAGDFAFDVPELTGLYHGDHANRNVDLELGMSFAQIDAVSLRLTGTHTPGVIQLLSHDAPEEPYPAEVIGSFPEAGHYYTTAFDELLEPVEGPFHRTFHFDNLRFHGGEPNFDPLLDGQARLNLAVAGPPVIAIYSIKSLPSLHVDSATLIVSGQAGHDHHMLPGDYDHNGHVDHADHTLWRATVGSTVDLHADGNGDGIVDAADYVLWRRHMGESAATAAAISASAPEPGVLLMSLAGVLLLLVRRRESNS